MREMLRRFLLDTRGGGEALTFAVVAIILAFFAMAMVEPIQLSRMNDKVGILARYALILAESRGELDEAAQSDIRSRAMSVGMDPDKLNIRFQAMRDDGSIKEAAKRAEYGERVAVQLDYTVTYDRITLNNLLVSSQTRTVTLKSPVLSSVATTHEREGGG
ncbi:hypothetical protein GTO91_15815 [Heliobacterium undosum]|uniref:Uncharacterized protein n=1 Tax=Heliomicrobium undosum TaxID=121734 RepID=A0A845L8Q6_9FIRM|nr:hypothetical protein [Heliomicrobium undosum]MZP31174.1 hypothetical protein [Heliomicrobium undosum]